MNKRIVIVTTNLTYPIDEGAKKFIYYFFKYASYLKNIQVFSSPEKLNIEGIHYFHATKLLLDRSLIVPLKSLSTDYILYIPYESSTFMSFLRTILLRISSKSNVKLICTQKRAHSLWQRFFIKCGHFNMITFSKSAADYYTSLGVNTNYYQLGVNTDIFKPISEFEKKDIRHTYGFSMDDKIILHVGHIKRKRNIFVLNALAKLGYKVLVVGSTSMGYDEEIANELESKGVKIINTFLPHVEELYQMCDCYVFPVLEDDAAIEFPLSVVEAMACNIPVVSTRFAGLKDAFIETDTFKFFETEQELIDSVNKVITIKTTHRNLILKDFTWNKTFENILNDLN